MMKNLISCLLLMQHVLAVKPAWQVIRDHHQSRPLFHKLKASQYHFGFTELDYGDNHPFEKFSRRRLEEEIDLPDQMTLDYDSKAPDFGVLRIKFLLAPLLAKRGQSSDTDSEIETILNEVLPDAQRTWMSYLSVIQVNGTIPIQSDECYGIFNGVIPSDAIESEVHDADLVIFVSAEERFTTNRGERFEACPPGALAAATSCALDQFDRPVVGFINFCVSQLSSSSIRRLSKSYEKYLKAQISDTVVHASLMGDSLTGDRGAIANAQLITLHEIGHVLGVNSDLYLFFRDPETGEPLTPRPFETKSVICANGTRVKTPFPETNTVQSEISSRGKMHYNLVTPRVQAVVRNHFNCQTLLGARLENQETSESCTGVHFDERLFYSELMGPIFSGTSDILSPLTLALLEDSGWYRVHYGGSGVSPFGHGAGCEFVNDDCIINDDVPFYAEGTFCTSVTAYGFFGISSNDRFCDPTHRSIGVCDLFDVEALKSNTYFDPNGVIDLDGIRYFSDSSLQSLTAQTDWCPVAALPVGSCTDEFGEGLTKTYLGEEYGPNSRCVNFEPMATSGRSLAGCFRLECDATNRTVIVNDRVCEFDGQRIEVPRILGIGNSTMICPKLAVVCPQLYCQGGCSGRGICNYETNQCECFDTQDESEICSAFRDVQVAFTLAPTPTPPPFISGAEYRVTSMAVILVGLLAVLP